jgi:hypothetical protein
MEPSHLPEVKLAAPSAACRHDRIRSASSRHWAAAPRTASFFGLHQQGCRQVSSGPNAVDVAHFTFKSSISQDWIPTLGGVKLMS